VRRERLIREREYLEALPDLARRLPDRLHPAGMDPKERALLAQALIPPLAGFGRAGALSGI